MITKTLSRLAAIQSLYQSLFTNNSINKVADEFDKYRFNKIFDESNKKLKYDKIYYNNLITWIERFNEKNDYEDFFSVFLKKKRPYKRLDIITKAILIVGTSEINNNKKLNKKILINDYIEIAKTFLNKPEVSLINAILDKIYEKKKES